MAIAYIMDSLSYSIFDQEWKRTFISISKDEQQIEVKNICTEDHAHFHLVDLLKEAEISLVKCDIPESEKNIVLRDDHGRDILLQVAKKLVHSPYVIAVVNSLPFNPHKKKFIKEVRENGLIEIVLPWTDRGLGLVVKTTGRTKHETEKIANILNEKYGYI